jgi:hypothetical protein
MDGSAHGPHVARAGASVIGYTVYRHPRDYPIGYVVRPWRVGAPTWPYLLESEPGCYLHVIACLCETVEHAREPFATSGLYRQPRYQNDDPAILEVWF